MTDVSRPSPEESGNVTPPEVRTCRRCLYDDSIPGIVFAADGTCSYCALHDQMEAQYPVGAAGEDMFQSIVDDMKADGRNRAYDCILGVSGGCDSSFLAHEMVRRGLRPLAGPLHGRGFVGKSSPPVQSPPKAMLLLISMLVSTVK